MNCLECVQICPVKETLDVRITGTKTMVPSWVMGALIVGTFIAITGAAMLTGHWHNSITKEEYLNHFRQINSSVYSHESAIRQSN